MTSAFSRIIKQTVSITAPRIWFYSAGLYLLGASLALALNQNPTIIPSWWFFLCLLWITAAGMVMGLSHVLESSKFVFPWEVIPMGSTYLLTGNAPRLLRRDDLEVRISIVISGVFLLLFTVSTIIFLDSRIFLLGIGLIFVDFLYNSKYINGRDTPFIDILCGAVYMLPILIGYVLIANALPDTRIILAGILYLTAAELQYRIVTIKNDRAGNKKTSATILGKEGSFLVSIALVVVCGIIFASYNTYYFLFVVPFLLVLLRSLLTKDPVHLHKLYTRAFLVHSITGFLAVFYFFIMQAIARLP